MTLRILQAARNDISEATQWYSQRQDALPLQFLDDLDAVLESMESHPSRLPVEEHNPTSRDVRYQSLSRFPYRVLCEVTESDAAVIAVIHQHRRPGFWADRLQ